MLALLLLAADWPSPLPMPEGLVPHLHRVRDTQAVATQDGPPYFPGLRLRPIIDRVEAVGPKWLASGGHEGVPSHRFRAERWRRVPLPGVAHFIELKPVKSSTLSEGRLEWAISRSYPDGTEFHDILVNARTGKPYEHRTRRKEDGKWSSSIAWKDATQRPEGYAGLGGQTCASCHSLAGKPAYGSGAVPGGDTVLSDPLDWSVLDLHPEVVSERRRPRPFIEEGSETASSKATAAWNPTLPSIERMRRRYP